MLTELSTDRDYCAGIMALIVYGIMFTWAWMELLDDSDL